MNKIQRDAPSELTVRARELRELFSEREFDPFVDEPSALWSIAQLAKIPEPTPNLAQSRLRVVLPANEVSPHTQPYVERAIEWYCSHKIAEANLEMSAWRRVAVTTCVWGLAFFALSLLLIWLLQRAALLPEAIRELSVETLVVAGWVVMWQPMDTLIQGWVPIRERERRFRAIGSMPVSVEAD